MKKLLPAFLLLFCSAAPVLSSEPLEELQLMIAATEQTLAVQKTLVEKTSTYLKSMEALENNSQSKQLAYQLVKAANSLKKTIDEERMSQAYGEDFLKELSFFAKMGNKPGLPPAS